MSNLLPKGASPSMSKRGEKDQLSNAQYKMGAFVPADAVLNREWRRRLKREKK